MSKKRKNLQVANARIYGYWQALFMAFYSKRLYVDVAKHWQGIGIMYLLFVIAIASIPFSARVIYDFKQYLGEKIMYPVSNLPLIYVQNGNVVFDKPMPYLIKNKEGEVVAIVDTTGQVSKINSVYPKLTLLVTKNKLYFRTPKFQFFFQQPSIENGDSDVFVQSLNKSGNEVFDAKAWIKSSGIIKLEMITEIFIYPLIVIFIFGMDLGMMLFLAFIGQLFAQIIFKFKVPYKQAARILMVASTAQLYLLFIVFTTNTAFPGVGLVYLIILAVYFNYGVLCLKHESKKMVLG